MISREERNPASLVGLRKGVVDEVPVENILAEKDFMLREELDKTLVQQYAENIEYILGVAPVEVWDTPGGFILTDGFHRLAAARVKGLRTVKASVKKGSVKQAYAAACLANLTHGKPLSRSERQRAIKEFIKVHPEWSNVRLSDEVGCGESTIRRYRGELEASGEIKSQEKREYSDGRVQALPSSPNGEQEPHPDPFDEWFDSHVIQGDALEVLPKLDRKYDLAIVDPPYGITSHDWDLTNKHELLAFTRKWLTKLLPTLKPTARLYVFWSREYMFDLKPVIDELQEYYPLMFGGVIVWHYRNVGSMPDNRKRYKHAWEPIFYYYGLEARELQWTPTEISGKDWAGEKQWDVWTYSIPQSNYKDKRVHPTQKPLDLYKQIIESATKTGETVIDPFAGSGTTGHAAHETGREFTLIEQKPGYVEKTRKRLKQVWVEAEK